jgi:hypothetical protein
MLMIYPEYREGIMRGEYEIGTDDFFTDFGKRAFNTIIDLESNGGYIYALLGEYFNPDEMSALEDMQQRRRSLAENGAEVFRTSIEVLKSESVKEKVNASGGQSLEDKLAEKRRRLEEARKKREE